MQLSRKLAVLADAAKYDASCASSGAGGRNSLKSGGIGSTEGMGICHSYTPDGRCVSPVSYTHLDVYKRQVPSPPSTPPTPTAASRSPSTTCRGSGWTARHRRGCAAGMRR